MFQVQVSSCIPDSVTVFAVSSDDLSEERVKLEKLNHF